MQMTDARQSIRRLPAELIERFNATLDGSATMSHAQYAQRLLLETLAGHFAWLQSAHPEKANSRKAKRARKCVQMRLRACQSRGHGQHRIAA